MQASCEMYGTNVKFPGSSLHQVDGGFESAAKVYARTQPLTHVFWVGRYVFPGTVWV